MEASKAINPSPKFLNRQDAKIARIHRAQDADKLTDATGPRDALEKPPPASILGSLGGPGGALAVKRFPRIRVKSTRQ